LQEFDCDGVAVFSRCHFGDCIFYSS